MITVLWYLIIATVVGAIVFVGAVAIFGRAGQMAPLPARTSPAQLPSRGEVAAQDVRKVRFSLALRGYRMSDVDWTLERVGDELELLRDENQALREQIRADGGVPWGVPVRVAVGAGPAQQPGQAEQSEPAQADHPRHARIGPPDPAESGQSESGRSDPGQPDSGQPDFGQPFGGSLADRPVPISPEAPFGNDVATSGPSGSAP